MKATMTWHQALQACKDADQPFVLATVLSAAGSTPRDTDAKMVITATDQYDTVGGGRLEHEIITRARRRLESGEQGPAIEKFALGSQLGQCCGGSVSILLESFGASHFNIALFGAGHVATALATILGQLPYRVEWVDSRVDLFPDSLPDNVHPRPAKDPVGWISQIRSGAHVRVMTHDHDLDFRLIHAALHRADLGSVGVIGSETKARRFRRRLEQTGVEPATINQLICPIGLAQVPGKRPMEVAVSIAGELIASANEDQADAGWRGLDKQTLKEGLG
ncbi:xanthine dehydrogenase accessory protein XdhC [Spiribacter sp. 218]|uniref:xanthine dehydrogenase accessory protein XdhC n=1 Tax=Spiribacter pallidus TaxID=1987936 RepID=UPI00349F47CE